MTSTHKTYHRLRVTPGKSVQIIRQVQNLSQYELARATGVSTATISAIELDRVHLGMEMARNLARALQCDTSVLVDPTGEGGPGPTP
jgi:transcriptional regulator with XRE-family HTH domain